MSSIQISFHRGGAESARSGTRSAYEAAVEHGAELIEFDVRRLRDGTLVCHHDATLDGTALASMTLADVRAVDDEILTYPEMLELAAGRTRCHIDFKEAGFEVEASDVALDVLGDPDAMIVTTLIDDSVSLFREQRPTLSVGLSLGADVGRWPPTRWVATRWNEVFPVRRLRRTAATAVAVHHRLLLPPLRRWSRAAGLQVLAWTVNETERLREVLADPDIHVVVTDRPLHARELRDTPPSEVPQ